ncbi:MAG: NAD(P)-binding domain-containing protein [Chitinophagaceae bacterium]|nr:NAD(P)-binding domain-containing protein [Chitinophagaceae bacterium]MCB9046420.1 NAD(P)-binding domain-containing protein [Chitinophagales bacterium]
MSNLKKIGILGSGQVARTLGNGFLHLGHAVMLGSRDITKLGDWKEKGGKHAFSGSFKEVAEFGEIIVLAVSGRAATEAIESAGPQNLKGKTIIDATNPISEQPPMDGVLNFFTSLDESLMEILQERYPAAHFVKAFNSVGNAYMVNPSFKGGKPSMFICGNNENAKAETTNILDKFGWETVDMGKAASARAIEPLCMLWCIPGFLRNEWNHAFKLLMA